MHVVIIGGGVAGPTAAVALRRAGLGVTVLEARPTTAGQAGAFLVVAPNGMRALRALVPPEVVTDAGGLPLDGIRFVNAAGRQVGRLGGRDDLDRYGGQGHLVRRGSLHSHLLEAAVESGAEVVLGAAAVGVEETDDGVIVELRDGRRIHGDLVVGADGVRSVARESLPAAPRPRYTGVVDCGGWTPVNLADTDDQVMVFGRRAFFGYVVRDGIAYWFTNVAESAGRETLEGGDQDRLVRIRELHRDTPEPVPHILESTAAALGWWPIYDVPHLPTWHTARICLVGDAAHATSPSAGQGASLAFEDAALLGRCLDELAAADAFAVFERLRKPRAEAVVELGRRLGHGKTRTGAAGWVRDRMLPLFLRLGARKTTDLYCYRVEDQSLTGSVRSGW